MKKNLFLVLIITLIMALSIPVFAQQEYEKTMQKEQIETIAEFYLNEFIMDDTMLKQFSNRSENISDLQNNRMIELHDQYENIIAYFIPISNEGYMIIDSRSDGYGMLESSLNKDKLNDILDKENEGKLYYIFPSKIFLYDELITYIEDEENMEIDNFQFLPIPEKQFNFNKLESVQSRYGHEVVELSNKRYFVDIYDGRGNYYYGGDQDWFYDRDHQDRGCGTVAAANITAYMSENVRGCSSLYKPINFRLTNFRDHMHDMVEYVVPTRAGVPTLGYLARGVEDFAYDRGVNLRGYWSREFPTFRNLSDYIKDGLRQDSPVAYLQYYNRNVERLNWHWVTITKYFRNSVEGDTHVAVSNWGKRESYNLDAMYDTRTAMGVIYFEKR